MKGYYTVLGTVCLNKHGYAYIRSGKYRNVYLHRAVMLELGAELPPGVEVHHQDNVRLHNWPENLLACPEALHASARKVLQCPFTGRFLTKREYEGLHRESDEVPF